MRVEAGNVHERTEREQPECRSHSDPDPGWPPSSTDCSANDDERDERNRRDVLDVLVGAAASATRESLLARTGGSGSEERRTRRQRPEDCCAI
jgi:hypothetical protein